MPSYKDYFTSPDNPLYKMSDEEVKQNISKLRSAWLRKMKSTAFAERGTLSPSVSFAFKEALKKYDIERYDRGERAYDVGAEEAYRIIKESTYYKPSERDTRGKLNELYMYFQYSLQNSETLGKLKTKEYYANVMSRLGQQGYNVSDEEFDALWEVYARITEKYSDLIDMEPARAGGHLKGIENYEDTQVKIMKIIRERREEGRKIDIDEIIDELDDYYSNIYEEEEDDYDNPFGLVAKGKL